MCSLDEWDISSKVGASMQALLEKLTGMLLLAYGCCTYDLIMCSVHSMLFGVAMCRGNWVFLNGLLS